MSDAALPPASAAARRVAVFRKDILPVSETFIPAQVGALRRWSPTLVGFQRVADAAPPSPPPIILYDTARVGGKAALRRDQFLPFAGVPGRRILAWLARTRPDLVHAHFGYDAVLVADAARALGIPLVVTLHGTDVLRRWEAWASGEDGFFFRLYPAKMKRLFADPAVRFVAVSEALRTAAIANGAPAARTEVVYTGIAVDRFARIVRRPAAAPTVLFVGRLVEFKGCDHLVRAMAEVQARLPAARLVVAGDGPQRRELERLAGELAVDVAFLGRVSPAEVERLLGEASLFCLPSVTDRDGSFEAFGMVMLEAQAAGVPVVTSAAAAAEAVVDGATGRIFPPGDAGALAAVLVELLGAGPARLAAMSAAARAHVAAAFDVVACAARLEDYYDRVVGDAAGEH